MSSTNTPFGGRCPRRPAATRVARRSPPWRSSRADIVAGPVPAVADVVAVGRLMDCLEHNRRTGGPAPGPDGLRYPDFGRQEAARAFGRLRAAVLDRSYRAPPPRPVFVPKADGTRRELALFDLAFRALATSVRDALGPAYAPHMSGLCHSAGGRGTDTLLADLAAAVEAGSSGVLLNLDVRATFPSLAVDRVMNVVRRRVPDEHMRWLVELLLRGGADDPIGIPQGLAVSPQHLDLTLSAEFDAHWPNAPGMPFLLRYVDNLPCLARDVDDGREAVTTCRTLLARLGLALKDQPEAEYLISLAAGGTTELLGFGVSLSDGRLRYDTGATALDALGSRLRQAHGSPHPPLAAKAVLDGWLGALGPAFDHSRVGALVRHVLAVTRRNGFKEFSPEHVRTV